MRWLDRLPSVKPELKYHLPDCPGLYFFVVGSPIYYVGKALNIKQRHSSEGDHDVYIYLNQVRPSLKKLFCIKWISFIGVVVPDYSLDTLLLGYEDYMIKVLCPRWNKRKNGVELPDSILNSITEKLMSESLSETIDNTISPENLPLTSSLESTELLDSNIDEELLGIAKKHAKAKRENSKNFTQNDWNMKENEKVQELVAIINSFSREENNPGDLIRLGLILLAKRINVEVLIEAHGDLSLLEKFHPETIRHPELLEIAQKFLKMYPNLTFDDLVLRCMGCSADDICPLDWAALRRMYSSCNSRSIDSESIENRENYSTNSF